MHPVIYDFGPVAIYSYGLMLGIAFIAGILMAVRLGQNNNILPDHTVNLGILILISAILGSRIFYILENFRFFNDDPSQILKFWSGGFVFYGGFIAAVISALLYCFRKKLSFLVVADTLSPGVALGIAIARIGCFLGGCCYGTPTTCSFGVMFPSDSPAAHTFRSLNLPNQPVHPVQLYGTVSGIILFIALYLVERKKSFGGQTFWSLIALYPIIRMILEIFRDHVDRTLIFNWSVSEFVSPIILITGITGYLLSKKYSKKLPLPGK